jgi:hypothetical protein
MSDPRPRPRTVAALLVTCAFLATALLPGTASAATTFDFEVSNANANERNFMKAFDAPSVAAADFDGDGHLELVAHNDNQYVYVISTQSPRILAEFRTEYPAGWNVRPINEPAVADLDGDGKLEIVVVNSAGVVCSYEYGGGSSSMTFTKRWCTRMTKYDGDTVGADAGAAIADVDGDGKKEVFTQTEQKGLFAFNHDGSVRWSVDRWGGNAAPLLTDLNGDGKLESVWFSDGGTVTALDANAGTFRWSFWTGSYGVKPGSISITGNAADLDNDGKKEVVFIARHATDADNYRNNHFGMFVLNHDGRLKWWKQPDWGNPLSYTHPILHDLNGDGKKDILAMDWNTIGHKPGNWEKLGQANVFAYDHSGTLLWRTQVDNSWSNDDLGLADVDGDGSMEVLAIGYASSGSDGIWYLDAGTGAKETHVPASGWTVLRGPVVADFDKDGDIDWAIPVHSSSKGGGFRFYDTGAPCRIAYGGWEVKDPCRGASSGGGGGGGGGGETPPPPTGEFDVTFTPKSGNEWWIQVGVSADQGVRAVDVSINGGSWRALTLRSWGDWAASHHAPEGSVVQFRATSSGGATDTSGCYRWTSGAPTTCPSGGSGGGGGSSFDATFRNVRGNEWWVETDVSVTGGTLAGVDARVNGGSWIPLEKRSWGSWAKSIHAPSGSTVEFRARSTGGATDTSGAYAWPPS